MRRFLRILRLGLYFNLVSAVRLSWKELKVGNWISRIQKKEYTLRPTGWAVPSPVSNLLSAPDLPPIVVPSFKLVWGSISLAPFFGPF